MTNRVRIAAALAGLALAAGLPASASGEGPPEETTSVGYATEITGMLKTVYRPPVLGGDVGALASGVTKTECSYDATGYGNTSGGDAYATFVARVVTSKSKRPASVPNPLAGSPLKDEAVATGVGCELRNGETNTVINSWEALFPGNTAANAVVTQIGVVRKPVICVWAWVYFGDGTRHDHVKTCNPGSLL